MPDSTEETVDSPVRRASQVDKATEEMAHKILEQSLLEPEQPDALELSGSNWDLPVLDPTQVSADYDKTAEQARVGDELNWERTPEGIETTNAVTC